MKKIVSVSLSLIIALSSFAQKQSAVIVLDKNQSIKFVTTVKGNISQESIAGNMDMNLDMASHKNILVKKVDKGSYQIDFTTTKLKMTVSVMGKDQTFDSDSSDKANGEMKDIGKDVNVAKPFKLTTDNICTSASLDTASKTEATDPNDILGGMMGQIMGSGNDEANIESYFMLIPTDRKTGDSWTDSVISTGTKRYATYKWDATEKNIATLSITEKIINDSKMEMMGMDISTNITNDITETRKIDIKTGILIEKKSTSKMSGTAEVMGMSMPMTGTIETQVTTE